MKVSLILTALLICLVTGEKPQTEKQLTEMSTGKEEDNGKGDENEWRDEPNAEICNAAKDVSVKSVYVNLTNWFIQLFIENSDGSMGWTSEEYVLLSDDTFPRHRPESSRPNQLGMFKKVDDIQDSQVPKKDGQFKRVSASFVHFSDSHKEKGHLVVGLSAYEFEIGNDILAYYYPTGNVKPITDFFKEGEELLTPEDKLEEVVSVALIKWVEKDKIKDHAIYKIILKTVTKKLVKAFFKLTSMGEVIRMNNGPFVPSVEPIQDEDEFNILEESALNNVREAAKLSIGYQFTSKFAFPIYYEYNPESNNYNEYPMRKKEGFNAELVKLAAKISHWNRYIVPTETFLGCPDETFCLGPSFDAMFFAGNQYYAIYGRIVYTLELTTNRPGIGKPLDSVFPIYGYDILDAAFTFGTMVFFIRDNRVDYITDSRKKDSKMLLIQDILPGIKPYSVSAVIALGKEDGVIEVNEKIPAPSKFKSERLRNHKKHERAAQTTEDVIPKQMIYVYFTNQTGGNVYQYKMETMNPPKFKLVSKKPYKDVHAALPMHISLAFTSEDKVVTMFHHFMTVQSSQNFFTQAENAEKFTFVDKYFGCQSEDLESKLTKEFVQSYLEFAGPKPGENVFDYPVATQEKTVSTTNEGNNEATCTLAQISTASFFMEAVLIIIFGIILI